MKYTQHEQSESLGRGRPVAKPQTTCLTSLAFQVRYLGSTIYNTPLPHPSLALLGIFPSSGAGPWLLFPGTFAVASPNLKVETRPELTLYVYKGRLFVPFHKKTVRVCSNKIHLHRLD